MQGSLGKSSFSVSRPYGLGNILPILPSKILFEASQGLLTLHYIYNSIPSLAICLYSIYMTYPSCSVDCNLINKCTGEVNLYHSGVEDFKYPEAAVLVLRFLFRCKGFICWEQDFKPGSALKKVRKVCHPRRLLFSPLLSFRLWHKDRICLLLQVSV
jgi:hypothetical protein